MNLKDLNPLIDDLASSVQQKIGFKSMPSITLQDDEDNADVLLGKTAYYDPQNKAVTVYVTNRHPKDILRSIAHELVHHGQNLRGEFDKIGAVGEGYAQNDQHLRNMEKEAYLKGNMCFRDWEDGYKRQMMESIHRQNSFKRRSNKMKKYSTNKNNELNKLLMEKFNFGGKKKEYDLEEGADRIFAPNHYCAHHVVHEGEEAYTVDHNWDEQLQEVTEYDIRFRDGTVKRNVPINELEVLEAFNEANHGNRDEDGKEDKSKHPPVKKTKKKDEKKVEEAHCMGNRDDDKKEDEKDEEQLYRYKNGKIVPVSKEFMAGRKVRKKVMKLLGLDESMESYGAMGGKPNTGQIAGSITVVPFGNNSLQPNGTLNLNLAVMGKDGEYEEFDVRPKLAPYETEEIFELAASQTMMKDEPIYENEELENPEKADLDKDGKLSGYEKKRGKAIEKSMKVQDKKKGKKGKVEEMDRSAEDEAFNDPKGAADRYKKRKKKENNESYRRQVRKMMEEILKLK